MDSAILRETRCILCKLNFTLPPQRQVEVVCPHCGGKIARHLLPLDVNAPQSDGRSVHVKAKEVSLGNDDAELGEKLVLGEMSSPAAESEYTLQPGIQRPELTPVNELLGSPPAPQAQHRQWCDTGEVALEFALADEHRKSTGAMERLQQSYGDSLPAHRDYPTLEAIQRLYKIFGYVTVGVVFPSMLYRLAVILLFAEDPDLTTRLIDFSWFAIPWIFGAVALTGTFFATAEGIKLAIDIQENTLAIARSAKRR